MILWWKARPAQPPSMFLSLPHSNSLSGSAVCAFSLEDVQRAFEGNFKGQDDINSNWLPIVNSKVPEPRPGQVSRSRSVTPVNTVVLVLASV